MSRSRLSAIGFATVLALLLLGLATPRLVSGVVSGPFDETVRALGRGGEVPQKDVRIARASRITALDWYDNTRYASDLGALNYALAMRQSRGSEVHSRLIAEAIASDQHAISLAPSAAFSWIRLAQAKVERDGAGADIAPYLRMSFRTASNDPRIVLPRLNFALAVWDNLPEDVQAMTADQIRLAMKWYPRELVRQTRARYRLAEVRDALRDDPGARARFNLLYFLRRDAV